MRWKVKKDFDIYLLWYCPEIRKKSRKDKIGKNSVKRFKSLFNKETCTIKKRNHLIWREWCTSLFTTHHKESLPICSARSISSSSKRLARVLILACKAKFVFVFCASVNTLSTCCRKCTSSFCRQVTKAHMFGWHLFIRLLIRGTTVYLYVCSNLTIGGMFSATAHPSRCNYRSAEQNAKGWYPADDDHDWRRQ